VFGHGHALQHPGTLERVEKEEPQRGKLLGYRDGAQLAISEQVGLILPYVFRPELVGRLLVVARELFDRAEVNARGNRGQVPTLEFFQHRFSQLSHGGFSS
jgi:hypothetical protein